MFNLIYRIKEKLLEVYCVKGEFFGFIVNVSVILKVKFVKVNDDMNTYFVGV